MILTLKNVTIAAALALITTLLFIYNGVFQEHIEYISHTVSTVVPNNNGPKGGVLFSLVRNEELHGMLQSIDNVQRRFNNEFKYDWVFANEVPFTEEFKEKIQEKLTSGKAIFADIPKEYWSYPDFIDQEKARKTRETAKYIYGDSESYRFMCRFNSGFFYKLKELDPYRYYWRVEPNIKFLCNILEDPFVVMEKNGYVYGWAMTMYEFGETITTLWDTVKTYIEEKKIDTKDNSKNFAQFITQDEGKTYNNCHFWSNFEVADLNFFRSKEYEDLFRVLEKAGGFFYERWGDAPVHSIAAALLLEPSKLHHFAYTGYYHAPNQACPREAVFREKYGCECNPKQDWTYHVYSCTPRYYDLKKLEIPKISH